MRFFPTNRNQPFSSDGERFFDTKKRLCDHFADVGNLLTLTNCSERARFALPAVNPGGVITNLEVIYCA
jgi:hypothetical protein